MKFETGKIGERGQVTIPIDIREDLGFDSGENVVFFKRRDGVLIKSMKSFKFLKDLEDFPDMETMFKRADKIKPKHNLSPEQIKKLKEEMYSGKR